MQHWKSLSQVHEQPLSKEVLHWKEWLGSSGPLCSVTNRELCRMWRCIHTWVDPISRTARGLELAALLTAHSLPRGYHIYFPPEEGNGNPLQYSCLENPMDGGAWWAAVHGVAKSQIRLSDFTFTFHFPALEKEMATHSSVLAWRIPGTGEPGGLPPMGSRRVGHD